MDKIVVLDFGSQYSHLICRRIREFSVYAELVPYDISYEELEKLNPTGIIFSGGPSSVYNSDAPIPENKIFDMNLPLLGICYGHQLIVNKYGGKVKRANKEYGSSLLTIDSDEDLLNGVGESVRAWMSHGDEAEQLPEGFKVIGHTESAKAAAIASEEKSIYGIQFHPEVVHTEQGTEILKNFVLKVCGAKQDWTMEGFIDTAVEKISKIEGNVLCGVSGGIDSTVVALLIQKAIGDRLKCVFVNNGLLRQNEENEVEEMFKDNFKVNFTAINAADSFLEKLKGIEDPEKKRKIVGEEFVQVFTKFAEENGPFKWLAQGTLYPDVIESGVSKGPAAVIKSHHNVGGLPDWLFRTFLQPHFPRFGVKDHYLQKHTLVYLQLLSELVMQQLLESMPPLTPQSTFPSIFEIFSTAVSIKPSIVQSSFSSFWRKRPLFTKTHFSLHHKLSRQNSSKFLYLVQYELLLDEIEYHKLIFLLMQLQLLLHFQYGQLL